MTHTILRTLSFCFLSIGLSLGSLHATQQQVNDSIIPQTKIYVTAEQMPQFPGGERAMQEFIYSNIEYPTSESAWEKEGRVTLRFVITETGEVTNCIVVRGLTDELNNAATRVVAKMPRWTPGKERGKNVAVYFTLPLTLRQPATQIVASSATATKAEAGTQEKPYTIVEQMPQFPGGEEAMQRYIRQNLRYPEKAVDMKLKGLVTVNFVVTDTGEIGYAYVVRGIGAACDKEALRVVKSMPKWTPGKQNGKDVAVYFTLPVIFHMEEDKEVPSDTTTDNSPDRQDQRSQVVHF